MAQSNASSVLKIGLAQMAPVLLNREATLAKIIEHVRAAAGLGCRLVAFGEALVPGYPFWIERTDPTRRRCMRCTRARPSSRNRATSPSFARRRTTAASP
jgi:predicted amidohydrolase